jgi:hypothetical protein
MTAPVPSRDILSSPSKKRLKLAISYEHAHKGLAFTLSELMGKQRVLIKKELVKVKKETIEQKGDEWLRTVKDYEEQFGDTCRALKARLEAEGRGKGIDDGDILGYVCSHEDWTSTVNKASTSLADKIGQYIIDFSYELLAQLLPDESSEFCRVFNNELDIPIEEAYESGKPEAWLNMPLLQLRVDSDILCLPWWLARTYDRKSIWCCRYALAVSPTLDDTDPPAILLEEGGGVHILSITRPTFDLHPWFPISQDTATAAYPFISDGVLTWRLLDGVIGDQYVNHGQSDLNEQAKLSGGFRGVGMRSVREALRSREKTPNLVVYQGHWVNDTLDDVAEEPPYLGLDDGRNQRSSKSDTSLPLSGTMLPVPLLTLIPAKTENKILIMNACSSGAALNQGRVIQKYIEARSVFIGANYPLLADLSGPSVDALLRAILRNRYLAHALSETNWLQTDLRGDSPDASEVFQKAGLCLFGDVRTSLLSEMDEKTGDNLARLTMKLTDKWADALDRLGLRDYAGMTFITHPEDLSPARDFSLTDTGAQLALAPLVVAIDLCNAGQGRYVILGPAFSSTESVAVVSKKFETWDDFNEELKRRILDNKQMVLGLLTNRLTSTYMTEVLMRDVMTSKHKDLSAEHLWRKFIKKYYAFFDGQGDAKRLANPSFIKNVDLSLVLNEPRATLSKLGNVLTEDLETQVVKLLGLEGNVLPRGILLTTRECLRSEKQRDEIIEFCNEFNKRVQKTKDQPGSDPADGLPDVLALFTCERANSDHLSAIRQFAETDFFSERSFGWENFMYRPRSEISREDAVKVALGVHSMKWGEHSRRFMKIERSSDQEINNLIERLTKQIETKASWTFTEIETLAEEVNRSQLAGPIKLDAHKHLRESINALKKTVVEC